MSYDVLREGYRRAVEPLPVRMIGGLAMGVGVIFVGGIVAGVAQLVGWTTTTLLAMGIGAAYGAWVGR